MVVTEKQKIAKSIEGLKEAISIAEKKSRASPRNRGLESALRRKQNRLRVWKSLSASGLSIKRIGIIAEGRVRGAEVSIARGRTATQLLQQDAKVLRRQTGLSNIKQLMKTQAGRERILRNIPVRITRIDLPARQITAKTLQAKKSLEKAQKSKGVIFLKKQELGERITDTQQRKFTTMERQATESIRLAEKILGTKGSEAGFILDTKLIPFKAEEFLQSAISKKLSQLHTIEKKSKKTKGDKLKAMSLVNELKHIESTLRKAEIFGLGMSSAIISNIEGVKQLPQTARVLMREVQTDPKNLIDIGKRGWEGISEEGGELIELYRISPTEAIGIIAGQVVFFVGTGKALRIIGKLGKVPAKAVKTALKGKKGTKIKLLGVQSVSGNKIITKIIFTKGKRQIGGAIGISTVKNGKVITKTVGKVGKISRITKKFKQKGVFTGRELTVARKKALKISKEIKIKKPKKPKKVKELTEVQRKRFLKKKKIAEAKRKKAEAKRKKAIRKREAKREKVFLKEAEKAKTIRLTKERKKALKIKKLEKKVKKKIKKKKPKKEKALTPKEIRKITAKALEDVKKVRKVSVRIIKRIRKEKLAIKKAKIISREDFIKKQKDLLRKSELTRKKGIRKLEIQKAKKIISKEDFIKKQKDLLRKSEIARKTGIIKFKIQKIKKAITPKEKFIQTSKNMEGLLQVGVGTITQAPGKKLLKTIVKFPTAHLKKVKAKGLTVKDFVSISRIFTKKDWNLIVGRTFSKKREMIEFMGLIKATSKKSLDSFSTSQKQVMRKALKQVVGVATASTTQGRKVLPKLSPKAKNLIAGGTGVTITKTKALFIKPIPAVKVKAIISKQKQIGITQTKIKAKQLTLSRQRKAIRSKQKVLVKQKPKTKQKQKALTKQKQGLTQKQKQLAKQDQAFKQKQKLLQKQRRGLKQKYKLITSIRPPPPHIARIPVPRIKIPIGLIKRKKLKKIKKKPVKKPLQAFDVWARPLKTKGQKKLPKLIKVSLVPLTEKNAKSLRNYIVDQSLGRVSEIRKVRGSPKKPKLKIPKDYAKLTNRKFRKYKIKKGKRIPLKKGRVIERKKYLLDVRSEKKGITLKRKLAQLRKSSKRKVVRRIPIKRKRTPARPSPMKRKRPVRRNRGIFG